WDALPETITLLESGRIDATVWIKEYYFGYYAAAAVSNIVRLGQTDALQLMGLSPHDLPANRICPAVEVITPKTVRDHVSWRRDRGL
ncbi:MAG: hypothetical protein LBG11_07515, partial [Bifidobacteriaceae bacterium]|nr:hypothetical protein [Bifidobacteriaceae bacterium]